MSQPAKAVWIEIRFEDQGRYHDAGSQPAKAVWIEIPHIPVLVEQLPGHSLRRLCGLKFGKDAYATTSIEVTACEGCVD